MELRQRFLLLFICLFSSGMTSAETESGKDNNFILILSSYDYEHEWSTAVAKSIRTELERNDSELLVSISYADIANRRSFLNGRLGMQAAFSKGRISATRLVPSVLVIIGDEAWMYYRIMNLRGVWENIPVVLVGVHSEVLSDYSSFFPDKVVITDSLLPLRETFKSFNIRALLRDKNAKPTIDLIKRLMPELESLYVVSRNNYQGQLLKERIRNYISSGCPSLDIQEIIYCSKETDSIKGILRSLPANAAIITNTVNIIDDGVSAPVFVVNETCLKDNTIVGGCYSSTDDYGRQAAEMILDIYNGTDPAFKQDILLPATTSPHLNKAALDFWKMTSNASSIQETIYENIPPPFYVKYKRLLLTVSLFVLVFVIIVILIVRTYLYRKYLKTSLDDFKKLYEEYLVTYENMPMGLIQFDVAGNVLKYNPVAGDIIEVFTKTDIRNFNVFQSNILGAEILAKIRNRENIDDIFSYEDKSFQIVVKYITNGSAPKDVILMILIDITEIQQEKKSKEEIYSVFSFAMNLSSLGLAEYNLLDGSGFATEAWYSNFGIDKSTNFFDIHRHVIEEDRLRISGLLQNIQEKKQENFLDNIRVNIDGKEHWLSYVVQLIEFNPERGRIILAALALNIDKQKTHETELAKAIALIAESDKMKNAFIANMSSEIRPSLDELVRASTELTMCKDKNRKEELMKSIEKNNEILLEYIRKIIELSHSGENLPNL